MIHREEDSFLRQIDKERNEVVAAALDFDMVALGYSVDADMNFCSAGHPAGGFFAYKKIGIPAKGFGAVNGVVVGQGDQRHSPPGQSVIDSRRVVVGFAAE